MNQLQLNYYSMHQQNIVLYGKLSVSNLYQQIRSISTFFPNVGTLYTHEERSSERSSSNRNETKFVSQSKWHHILFMKNTLMISDKK